MAFDPTQPYASYNDTTGTHLFVQQSAYYLPYPPYLPSVPPAPPLPGSGIVSGGLPSGGLTGQVLAKNSSSSGDVVWSSATGGVTRTYRGVAASQAAMLALSATVVGDWCERSDLANQVFELTTTGPATLANWTAYPSGGVTTFAALTDAASATIAVTNTSVANALVLKANKGHVDRAADVTTGRAFVSTDFGVGVVPLNNAAVQAFTLNTAVTMGITGTGNVLPIQILGAVHTLTAGTGVTITYGSTSYAAAAVTGFVPVLNQTYVLVQRAALDTWDLS